MVARGEPLSDQLRLSHALGLGVKGAILVDFDAHCSIVRHATSHHLDGFLKVRAFSKAETQISKCCFVGEGRNVRPLG